MRSYALVFALLLPLSLLRADGPEDNNPKTVRPIPPKGNSVPTDQLQQFTQRVHELRQELQALGLTDEVSCEIEVFLRAVEITIDTEMLYGDRDLQNLTHMLDEATRRLQLAKNQEFSKLRHSTHNERLVLGGFRSQIDDSVQPYGLVLPENWTKHEGPFRLDIWLHGRGERVSEAAFLDQRGKQLGQYSPEETIVLHPYGRYSNAFKFAGEIDVLEALEHVKSLYPIDEQRLTIRGFSMGGAGCWQLAVHYPNLWAAANPGAGFSETSEFLSFFQNEEFQPTWYQSKLLHWYDCPDWTNNLRNVPTVAYSGEVDRQKQAADVMAAAFEENGMRLTHVIGPNTAHKIHPDSKITIQNLLEPHLAQGKPKLPEKVDLTTYTLRYNQLGWLTILGLSHHWEESRVHGQFKDLRFDLTTKGVTKIQLTLPPDSVPKLAKTHVHIDGQQIDLSANADGGLLSVLTHDGTKWKLARPSDHSMGLAKRPGLQGPIDDAFMSAFTFVGPSRNDESAEGQWAQSEFERAKREWRRHFRGDIPEMNAGSIDKEVLESRNLVLFGTPKSNPLIAKLLEATPIVWKESAVRLGSKTYSGPVVPIFIFPNPIHPNRYVVVNSGFTFREFAYLNNARQIPMLPDWAVVDVSSGATTQFPGKVLDAGFFNEEWELPGKDTAR